MTPRNGLFSLGLAFLLVSAPEISFALEDPRSLVEEWQEDGAAGVVVLTITRVEGDRVHGALEQWDAGGNKKGETIQIVALGASNVSGKGVARTSAWPAQLETMLRDKGYDVRVMNAGIQDDTSAMILARLDGSVPLGTHIVTLGTGAGNDRRQGVNTASNVRTITRKLRERQIEVIVIKDMPAWADGQIQPDGMHLTLGGHTAVANKLLPKVVQAIRDRNFGGTRAIRGTLHGNDLTIGPFGLRIDGSRMTGRRWAGEEYVAVTLTKRAAGAADSLDGVYAGDICLGPGPNGDPARCFRANATVRDGKIAGGWAGREGVTVTLAGEVATTGGVKIEWHAERADGSQFARATLSGTIENGHLDARGTFENGRTVSFDWGKTSSAPYQMR